MQDVEFYVKKTNGNFELVDLGESSIYVNYQRNNISEIKDRQVDYSQQINLPITPQNCRIFGLTNVFDVASSDRRKLYECQLFSAGVSIVGVGASVSVLSITDTINVQIVGPEYAFYDKLKDLNELGNQKTINDLNFTESILFDFPGFSASPNYVNTGGVLFFGIADFAQEDEAIYSFDPATATLSANNVLPFVRLKAIVEHILSENGGYSITTSISNDLEYKNACIPLVNRKLSNEAVQYLVGNKLEVYNYSELISWQENLQNTDGTIYNLKFAQGCNKDVDFVEGQKTAFTVTGSNWDFIKGELFEWTSPYDCSVTFNLKLHVDNKSDASTLVYFQLVGGGVNIQRTYPSGINIDEDFTLTFLKGNKFHVFLTGNTELAEHNDTHYWVYDAKAELKAISLIGDNDGNFIGSQVGIKGNLPDVTQYDFIKAFLQLYGLSLDINERTKTVTAYTISDILENRANAKNWSKYSVVDVSTVKTTIDSYAKNNTIKLKEGVTYPSEGSGEKIINQAMLTVDGDMQPTQSADLFEIAFTALTEIDSWAFIRAKIRYLNAGSISNSDMVVCLVSNDTKNVLVTETAGGDIGGTFNQHIDLNEMSVSMVRNNASLLLTNLVQKYYAGLQKILNDPRNIEDEPFLLPPKELNEFSPLIPIYLEKYGSFFYVNKIKNYKNGEISKVDLIKI